MRRLVVLRPEPGAGRTAAGARMLGFEVLYVPLFTATPLAWEPPPPEDFDAILLTSAHGARLCGAALARYCALPAYAVGKATANAMREQGFDDVIAGEEDGSAIAAQIAADGHRAVLHLAGTNVAPLDPGALHIRRIAIYAMVETDSRTMLLRAVTPGTILLVHSPRAGQRLKVLLPTQVRARLHIVAISPAACTATGEGWASAQAATQPTDEAMLALAAQLCK